MPTRKAGRKAADRKGGAARKGSRETARRAAARPAKPASKRASKRASTRKPKPGAKQRASLRPVPRPLSRLRTICLSLPEAHEVEAWGEPTFRVRNKLFAMYAAEGNHHGSGRPGVWLKATGFSQDMMVRTAPDRFFVPPYVGPSGWVGVWLDGNVDWEELAELVADAHRMIAAKRKRLATSD